MRKLIWDVFYPQQIALPLPSVGVCVYFNACTAYAKLCVRDYVCVNISFIYISETYMNLYA